MLVIILCQLVCEWVCGVSEGVECVECEEGGGEE